MTEEEKPVVGFRVLVFADGEVVQTHHVRNTSQDNQQFIEYRRQVIDCALQIGTDGVFALRLIHREDLSDKLCEFTLRRGHTVMAFDRTGAKRVIVYAIAET